MVESGAWGLTKAWASDLGSVVGGHVSGFLGGEGGKGRFALVVVVSVCVAG